MLDVKCFVFNPFGVNTYVIVNQKKEAIIIDAACYNAFERDSLFDYISDNNIIVKFQINTHCHIDHILGNSFIAEVFDAPLHIHLKSQLFLDSAKYYAKTFGLELDKVCQPEAFVDENYCIKLGDERLDVLYTPGHADGSICLVSYSSKFVITGDVLFKASIGRTDLPTGNLEVLLTNIKNKILTLPDDFTVYPGHGDSTNIKSEKIFNPFIK